MRTDIVSMFPEYFEVMNLNLMGKTQTKGLLEIETHNLHDWAHDVHHSVDNAPIGGGADIVMEPKVWGECPDELLGFPQPSGSPAPSGAPVLISPNLSAPLFTQCDAIEFSRADHLLFGRGRYKSYNTCIPDYYRTQGVDVREYSTGDYVLNGGEVMVSVILEAIIRLIPGFMGNPDSIVRESYTDESVLLKHRQYTRSAVWRGTTVPDVLLSGDHGRVGRFRRDKALVRTAEVRPDLIATLDCKALDKADRETPMALGWEVSAAHPRRLAD